VARRPYYVREVQAGAAALLLVVAVLAAGPAPRAVPPRPPVRLDANAAPAAALAAAPGVGAVLARRIVAGRPYADAAALRRVLGRRAPAVEPYLFVGPPPDDTP